MPWRKFLLPAMVLALAPTMAMAEGVIGIDSSFSFTPVNFLTSNPDYAAAFNYFFTIEVFVGLVAFWLRISIRPFRM